MSRKRPYCDIFEDNWYIAQANGLNLSLNTEKAAEIFLQLLAENARLQKESAELRGALQDLLDTGRRYAPFFAHDNQTIIKRAERALALKGGE